MLVMVLVLVLALVLLEVVPVLELELELGEEELLPANLAAGLKLLHPGTQSHKELHRAALISAHRRAD